ncbi:ketopantoate reductase family protein [Glutamicibacter sp. NPDC087344]|uniref:ketopantoate reductase family protein n=1 Tax=Glutamicibacter sp. NPDC087344 TaxID=3363994 RepID=UPI0037FFA794
MTRILIVGAGATGGTLGARLLSAGREVTFLVRERRAEQLAANGLRYSAPGEQQTHRVHAVTSLAGLAPFDLVIITVKAPALKALLPTLAPAIGPGTLVLPLLNGMSHLELLERTFPGRVLGGLIRVVATFHAAGEVEQMTSLCTLSLGGLGAAAVPAPIRAVLDVEGINLEVDPEITARLWEKWAFIAAAGVVTCLFRGTVGDILAAGGEVQIRQAITEGELIAQAAGYPVSQAAHHQSLGLLTEPGSAFTSSLYRDLQHGDPQEAEHLIGDFAAHAARLNVAAPLLNVTLLQLRTHKQALIRAKAAS